LEEDPAGR